MTEYQPQRRTVAFDWHGDPYERFAKDVKLPEPGSHVRFNGRDAKLVSCQRINDTTLRMEVELPEGMDDIFGRIVARSNFSFRGETAHETAHEDPETTA